MIKKKSLSLLDYINALDFDFTSECFEVRVISTQGIQAGFFNNPNAAIKEIERFDTFCNVYLPPNPRRLVCPEIENFKIDNKLSRRTSTGKNESVSRVRWFLIDIDTIRYDDKHNKIKKVMANDIEIENSKTVFNSIINYLNSKGISSSSFITNFSGNGRHILIKTIDYPITISDSFSKLLNFLKSKFDNEFADVDPALSDPCRLLKCPFTQAQILGGTSTSDRPYRYSKVVSLPSSIIPVDIVEIFKDEIKSISVPTQLQIDDSLRHSSNALFLTVVDAFKKSGKYIKDIGMGKHAVICPWADKHSSNTGIKETIIIEPNEKNIGFGFCCQHSSHDSVGEKTYKDIMYYFKIDKKDVELKENELRELETRKIEKLALGENCKTIDKELENLCEEEDSFCPPEVMMVFAQDSAGKSLLLIKFAYGMATGTPFWGNLFHPKNPTKVLYFNADKSRVTFQQKYILRLLRTLDPINNLEFQHKSSFIDELRKLGVPKNKQKELSLLESEELLCEYIKEKQFKVFIVDTLYGAADVDFDAAEPKKISKICRMLKRVSVECNCFICFTHHTNKLGRTSSGKKITVGQDDFQGSRQLSAQIYSSVSLEVTDKEQMIVSVKPQKVGTSRIKSFDFQIIDIREPIHIVDLKFISIPTDAELKQLSIEKILKDKKEILEAIKNVTSYIDVHWCSMSEIKLLMNNLTILELNDYLTQLVLEGLLLDNSPSKNKKYQLTEKGKTKVNFIKKQIGKGW